jgi:hypothetical protein
MFDEFAKKERMKEKKRNKNAYHADEHCVVKLMHKDVAAIQHCRVLILLILVKGKFKIDVVLVLLI